MRSVGQNCSVRQQRNVAEHAKAALTVSFIRNPRIGSSRLT
jgi:hypothetical protein